MGGFVAGDSVLFKRGEAFTGTLVVTVSGSPGSPVVFGAYGEGGLPELTGFTTLSGWQAKGGGIWEAAVPGGLSYMNTVTVNGAAMACGRYPNATAAGQGYLYYDSYNGNTSISDNKLASLTNFAGGQLVMRKTRWVIDRNEILSQSGTTINYSSQSGYGGAKGYGYFIQNHPATLDTEGEWYYQGGRLGIFTNNSPGDNYQVRAGVTETLVRLSNQGNISFEGLRLSGATVSAFEISYSQHIRISGCEVVFSGKNAINATGTDGLTVENTTIAHTGNNAISVNGGNNTILRGNQVRGTAVYAGMGDGGDGTYEGVTISGNNNLVANNTIDSTGYIGLNFSGDNVTVKNNVVSNFGLAKDDGGGIYTWNNGTGAATNSGRVVTGNIVLNGIGAPGGTDNPAKAYAHGIYIDDNAGQVEISSNTVANCASYGVYIHNAHDIVIKQNTLYNNATQLYMEHDNVAADRPVYNCTVTSNVLFAKLATQLAAEYKTKDNDIGNFGSFDGNYYYRPQDNDLTIGVLQQVNGVYSYQTMGVGTWKALYGKDANAIKPSHSVPAYTITKVTGVNQFSNGTFDSNIGGLYAYAAAGNCVTSWDSGALDGGALKVSFSSTTGSSSYGSVIMGVGAVTAGKCYRLKFSMLGGNSYKAATTYLRQGTGSYSDLSERKASTISGTRIEKEFLFTATANEGNAAIVFDVPEQPSPVYFDNIRLEQVEATATNADNYISFLYNPTTS
ncbi:right-handed parallel beta-helix repeat-containing protein, partial [Mucilaginibacter arboris]